MKLRGIKVAVWENWGPDRFDDLEITDSKNPNPATDWHATLTHAIIKNKEKNKPHGHAPSCELYSANEEGTDALEWAVLDKECTVINQSFHRSKKDALSSTLSNDDVLKDWLVVHWPYPTIIQAAGNLSDFDNINPPEKEYVNHKGYNSLRVGNHDDSASSMFKSAWRNPSSSNGDRELPEICANGNGNDVWAAGVHGNGTSFASPAVAGVVALLQGINNTLKIWPEGCRAILLAGAKINVTGSTWFDDVLLGNDAQDGSGALDALESAEITKNRSKKDNDPATQRGWDIGTLTSTRFGKGRYLMFSYNLKFPEKGGANHVKVAMAWNSKVTSSIQSSIPIDSSLTMDLDIEVYDDANILVGKSDSFDNSYEIAEFNGEAGKMYKIKIRKHSGSGWTWYGIAWTVV